MLKNELKEILRNGESSGVEFKRDDVHADSLAKEVAALLNLEGGHILLGVEDDGSVTGLTRAPATAEEWVMNVCRDHVRPAVTPYWETVKWDGSKTVGKQIKELSLPEGTKLALVIHQSQRPKMPSPETTIRAEDRIIAITSADLEEELRAALRGE